MNKPTFITLDKNDIILLQQALNFYFQNSHFPENGTKGNELLRKLSTLNYSLSKTQNKEIYIQTL